MKRLIQHILENYAQKLIAKYQPKIIAITGSVGKTSTRSAVSTLLGTHYRVLVYSGNYNVDVAVPVVLFGLEYPKNPRNPFAWLKIFSQMRRILKTSYSYDVAVLELGADQPGDIEVFARYLQPDIAIVTAVSPEHMENFKTLEAVAKEELVMTHASKMSLVNKDDFPTDYTSLLTAQQLFTYGLQQDVDYHFTIDNFSLEYGYDGRFYGEGLAEIPAQLRVVGDHNIKPVIAAVATAAHLGVPTDKITAGVGEITPVNGRMNLLRGADHSIILDDSYNSSPLAAKAAIDTLYKFTNAPARYAVLGSMNELGDMSPEAHQEVGQLCDPSRVDYLVTVGADAEKYLAPAARQNGCRVKSFESPYDAAVFLRPMLQRGSVVLVKGSQNRVFTEEAAKLLLEHPEDEKQLVRQSPYWMKIKRSQFNS